MSDSKSSGVSTWVFLTVVWLFIVFFAKGCDSKASIWDHYLYAKYGYKQSNLNYGKIERAE